ncbi:dethiobiotin synthase [Buchnera aphidicola]|uniref:dethiobiotin synthase n=1 Tax=Buchnera aphidicola TaxID=9 RepID=UPI0031B6EB2B
MKKKIFFVTGTDTNIGKTTASILLLKAAKKIGYSTAGYKPIAAGCKKTKFGLRNEDALLLKKYSSIQLSYNEVNPYPYKIFHPPSFDVKENKKKGVSFKKISLGLAKLSKKKANWIIIEGAGGWHTPLSTNYLYSDWVIKEKINVILIVGIKIGCINHAILTSNEIISSGAFLSGWIANHYNKKNSDSALYINFIKNKIPIPFLGEIPYVQDIEKRFNMNINFFPNILNFNKKSMFFK